MTQTRVFEKLCGPGFLEHVILGTTFWETVSLREAEDREDELFSTSGFFGDMKAFGAKPARVYKDRESCLKILEMFAENQGAALRVQEEMLSCTARSTDAFSILTAEMAALKIDQENEMQRKREAAAREIEANNLQLKKEEKKQIADIWRQQKRKERQHKEAQEKLKREQKARDEERQDRIMKAQREQEANRLRQIDADKRLKEKAEEEQAVRIRLQQETEQRNQQIALRNLEQSIQRLQIDIERQRQRLVVHSRSPLQRRGESLVFPATQ